MGVVYAELGYCGRLGNQLWEIASTIGIAHKHNTFARFPFWDYQRYFSVPDELFMDNPRGPNAIAYVPYMDPRARSYLQDYSLFSGIEETIRSYFTPSVEAQDILRDHHQWLESLPKPWISVHVRRGDNVTHPLGYHPLRSLDYYRRALELLPSGSIVMFTDDADWCEQHFERQTDFKLAGIFEGVTRPREYADRVAYETSPVLDWIDLQLMTYFDHHVISNSTYAWWGAFLSNDPSPIYPDNWFGSHIRDWTDASLMFPSTWRQVHDDTQGGV